MKRILVHLDASPRAELRLRLGVQLARRHAAELSVLYAELSPLLASPWLAGPEGGTATALIADLEREQLARARALFERETGGFPAQWLQPETFSVLRLTAWHAFTHDLLVLGRADPATSSLAADFVAGAIIDSGRPALVVPGTARFDAAPDTVLLAWKPTREASRAVTAALPWLRAATQVHLAARPEGDEPDSSATVEHWLRCEGVTAPVTRHRLGTPDVGEALLSLAEEVDAGLIAMGCYGHGRTREWVLGGASRTVLREAARPVRMVH